MILQTDLNLPSVTVAGKKGDSMRVDEYLLDLGRNGIDEYFYRTTAYLSGIWVHQLLILPVSYDTKRYAHFGSFIKYQRELDNVSEFSWQLGGANGLKGGDYLKEICSQIIYELIELNDSYCIFTSSSLMKNNSPISVVVLQLDDIGKVYPACFLKQDLR